MLVRPTGETRLYPLLRCLVIVWSSPTSLVGVLIGGLSWFCGGTVRWRPPTLEFHGGLVSWLLTRLPGRPIAMTLGHTILGAGGWALDVAREHEMVHVRQCERWGPFFLPAYLACSLALWIARRDPYLDNPFEREAYDDDRRRHGEGR